VRGRIIYNPAAGPRDVHRELQRVRRELRRHGWSVDVETTRAAGDVTRLARQAADEGLDAVWIAGGDGSISEAANGLVGSGTAMAVLPVGTGNTWAKQLRLPTYTLTHPFRLREAAAEQARGEVRAVDVGRVNGRHFLLWVGIGFDALVTSRMEPRPRPVKRLGALPYVVAAAILARHFSGVRTRILLDGHAVRGRTLLVLVSNVQMYAFLPVVCPAKMDDGFLDLLAFRGLGPIYIFQHAAKMFSGRHLQDPKIVHRKVRQATVWTDEPVSVQADGEMVGTTPVTLHVVPRALRILVPPQAPRSLFDEEGL